MSVLYSFPTADHVSKAVAKYVASKAAACIAETGRFTVALSGGSLPKLLATYLKEDSTVDWTKWYVFFADERVVPLDHMDSNYYACFQELFSKVSLEHRAVKPGQGQGLAT